MEDAAGFMTKMKLPYYLFWKQMRGLTEAVYNLHDIDYGKLYTPLYNQFFAFLKSKEKNELKQTYKQMGIIGLRDQFYKEMNQKVA